MAEALEERTRAARELFAPLGPTYDRWARLLSLGQDPRWRGVLVSRMRAGPDDTVLDVATGTAAVAIELARRHGCRVVGVDQSPEMLAVARRRVETAGLADRIHLEQASAEALPFQDASFAGLSFTYLLRYVDDPAATLRELARTVRPGGRLASLEFFVPENPLARLAWEAYVRAGLPAAGRLISPGWATVGSYLGPSIRSFYERFSLGDVLSMWRSAGITDPRAEVLSLGGGVVVWGDRGD